MNKKLTNVVRVQKLPGQFDMAVLDIASQWRSHKLERFQIFEHLEKRILSEVQLALMPELLSFIRSETDAFAVAIEHYAPRWTWWPLWDVWEKIEQSALNQIYKDISVWLSERMALFTFSSDEALSEDWQRIHSNFTDLQVITSKIVDLSRAVKFDVFSPWHLNLKFEPPLAFNLRCRVHLPVWPAILPVFMTREWLNQLLRKEKESLASHWRNAVMVYAADNVRKALEHLSEETEMRADEIYKQVIESVENHKPSGTDHGKETKI